MTDYTHEQIKKMLEGITQGEWRAEKIIHKTAATWDTEAWEVVSEKVDTIDFIADCGKTQSKEHHSNATFIAAAPAIVRQLLEEVEKHKLETSCVYYWSC